MPVTNVRAQALSKPPCGVASDVAFIASLQSNLSFLVYPALNKRDRFVPRDDR